MVSRWLIIGDPGWAPLSAWADGLRLSGVEPFMVDHREWRGAMTADAVAIYGLRGHGRDILDHYKKLSVPVVVIDHGYMKRVQTIANMASGYLQVGIGRLGWVPPHAPADRLAALGIKAQSRAPRQIRRALILGQVGFDASHRRAPDQLVACYERLAEELIAAGARSVAYRGHPLGADVRPRITLDGMSGIEDAVERADLVVSLNSNAGLDALIAGCPAVTLMDSHYAALAYRWPVRVALIEPPPAQRVTTHLERLAYAQWTVEEIREGLPHRYLQSLGAIP